MTPTRARCFFVILGQLDDGITARLKCRSNWKGIYTRADTIDLLNSLRDACYDINMGHTFPPLDMIRKMEKFYTCEQKSGQDYDDYVEEVKTYFRVLKAAGHSFQSESLTVYTLEHKLPEFLTTPLDSLSDDDKSKIQKATDDIMVATKIVEGTKHANIQYLHYTKVAG